MFGRLQCWLCLATLAAANSCAPSPEPIDLSDRSLLLISIDTLRSDRLGAYGDGRAKTPNIDRLAEHGVRFESCYSPVPLTLPSHSSLFTGRYPFAVRVRNNGTYFLRPEETTLAERLHEHGFRTAAFVSTYILGSKFGLDQGFEHYDDGLGSEDLVRSFTSEMPADRVVGKFAAWLTTKQPGPFFVWLHFYDPHQPYLPPEPFAGFFQNDPYRGEIAFVDQQVGMVLDQLDASELLDKTLIVLTSDHGEAFGEHGEEGHGIFTYEESLRVPLILYAPGRLPSGRVIGDRVRLIDLLPTLFDFYGLEPEPGLPGQSLVPLLEGQQDRKRRDVYFESVLGWEDNNWAPITGLIAGRHKYISLPEPELYELEGDPEETHNLHGSEPEVARRLDRLLRKLLEDPATQGGATRRELTAEDAAHLRALGYLGSSPAHLRHAIDPKQGIVLDRRLRAIRRDLDTGDLAAATAGVEALLEEHPQLEMPAFFGLRHELAAAKHLEDEAVRVLEEGISIFPDSERMRFLLAHYLVRLRRYEEAERLCREVLERNPRHSQVLILLGQVAEAQSDPTGAVEHYKKARALEPNNTPLRLRLAAATLQAGEADRALKLFNALADEGALDGNAQQLYKAAALNGRLGEPLRAEALFRRGLELEPAGVHHLSFAFVLVANRKPEEAGYHLEIALREYGDELTPEQREAATSALRRLRGGV